MRAYSPEHIRNVVLVGHSSSGKTSLAEALLFNAGAINRMGRVEEGNTVSDYTQEEARRSISIYTSVIPFEWRDCKINVLDTPGYPDFVGEVKGAIRVADIGLVLVDAVSGVEVGTELTWSYLDERQRPRAVLIHKMNRENADFQRALESVRGAFSGMIVPLHMPIGSGEGFRGVIDLVAKKAYIGEGAEAAPLPDEYADEVEERRLDILEAAAEMDDELITKYLEGEELTVEEIARGLRIGIAQGRIIPVLAAAATANIGIKAVMDAIAQYFPSPADMPPAEATDLNSQEDVSLAVDPDGPLAAFVFKTVADPYVGKISYFRVYSGTLKSDSRVWNSRAAAEERVSQVFYPRGKEHINTDQVVAGDIGAVAKLAHTLTNDTLCTKEQPFQMAPIVYPNPLYSVAVHPKTKQDAGKLTNALSRLQEEDPTLVWHYEASTKETILSGMGDVHIDVAVRYLKERFGVDVDVSLPKVPYRETVTASASGQYRHKKQTGGAGQFAEVHMEIKPLPRGGGFEYDTSRVFGGAISSQFFPSIEKGIKAAMEEGPLAGYPVVDVRCEVYDGKEHPVDSKDIAFQIAGREVFKKVFMEAKPALLEPIMKVEVIVPDEYVGDIISDLNTRRAIVQGMEQERGRSIVRALVPLAEMQRYATDLRSLTQGRGVFNMEFSHYEIVPHNLAEKIIEQAKKEKEEEKK